ncbi:MAG TPA: subclass B3 metallo-beta-lactamase [Sphingomicrobium sp.]|nr:subclass B3 metallo-beta-lactamase [Sphingomicrobium sp.]
MSASHVAPLTALLLLSGCAVSIPIQPTPPQIERPIAPVETAGRAFAAACKDWDDWDKPAPPVRVHGNTYYVGTCGISAILVTDKSGHILIDGATEAGAEVIAGNIQRLGFNLSDVKYLLHSHEHLDHVGGIARLQHLTGAQLVASPAAATVFKTGTTDPADPQAGMHPPFRAARVDRIIRDGEMVRVGDTALFAIETPGHTPGALTWRWGSCDGGVCRQIVYADSLSAVSRDTFRFTDHPSLVAAFRGSFQRVASLECDILLTPHPSASDLLNRFAGRAPLSDPEVCRAYAKAQSDMLDQRLAKEAAAK